MKIFKGRAQCIVVRDGKILMAKHREGGVEYYCIPGGGIEAGETPEQAAVRELREECCVEGKIIQRLGEYHDPYEHDRIFYNYQLDIGEQEPKLGYDPEFAEKNAILVGVKWLALNEMSERDRAFLWSAGIFAIKEFAEELQSYSDDISYPKKAGTLREDFTVSKFIYNDERDGSCYLEFQICETDNPLKNGRVRCGNIRHWSDNSLYMDWDDFNEFYELYGDVFCCAVFPNGERGCDSCGVNYYGKEETEKIIEKLSARIGEEYAALLPWLKIAEEHGKGFYILGV